MTRLKHSHLSTPVIISLIFLAVIVMLAGIWGFRWFDRGMAETGLKTSTSGLLSQGGQSASTSAQINGLSRLSQYTMYKRLASLYVSRMTLDEELGQLIMVQYTDADYAPDLNTMINKLHAGGVILYEFQMRTFAQMQQDIALMQRHAALPLLISTDEEGGPFVDRLGSIYGVRMSAADMAATGDVNVAGQQGLKTGRDLLALGINTNLAPVVDVDVAHGDDLVSRTFGSTPASVIRYAGAYLKALQESGVIGCIKHFPGLGSATSDAHTGLPVVNRTKEQLYAVELAPFKAFIQAPDGLEQPGMIMATDVLMPAIDAKYPAELSHAFMTDILRNEFGYDGVVLTDALYMQGVAQRWSLPEAAVVALNAGDDMLLGPSGVDSMVAVLNGLKVALRDGMLSKARVDEAATRIIALKMEYHVMAARPPQP